MAETLQCDETIDMELEATQMLTDWRVDPSWIKNPTEEEQTHFLPALRKEYRRMNFQGKAYNLDVKAHRDAYIQALHLVNYKLKHHLLDVERIIEEIPPIMYKDCKKL